MIGGGAANRMNVFYSDSPFDHTARLAACLAVPLNRIQSVTVEWPSFLIFSKDPVDTGHKAALCPVSSAVIVVPQ
jgi:hypothetical protein